MNIGTVNTNSSQVNVAPITAIPAQEHGKEDQPAEQSEEKKSSREDERMAKMVEEMQRQIDSMSVSLEFTTYGEHDEKMAIVVKDKKSGDVIREIPSKEVQEMYAKMRELNGIIFNMEA